MTIDELVIELVLDPKKLNAGQRAAIVAFKQTEEDVKKHATSIEEKIKRAVESISHLQRTLVRYLAAFLGGRTLKNFIDDLTGADVASGKLARNFGVSVKDISKWQKAVELSGGSAEGVASSLQSYSDALTAFRLGIGNPQHEAMLTAIAAESKTAISTALPVTEQWLQLSEALSKIGSKDRNRAFFLARQLGLDSGTADLMVRGIAKTKEYLTLAEKYAATDHDVDVAERYQTATVGLRHSIDHLGRSITPAIEWLSKIFDKISELFDYWSGVKVARTPKEAHDALRERFGEPPAWVKGLTGESPTSQSTLRTKPGAFGAGSVNAGTYALAWALQASIPGLDRFTAANDSFHAFLGTSSKHKQGLALDFTLKDPAKAAEVAAAVRAKLAEMGIDAQVLDEYNHPSKHSTGGHIHVGFGSAEAARRYYELSSGARTTPPPGTPGKSSSVSINTVVVNTLATDAEGIARDIRPALERAAFAMQANYGAV